MKKMMLGAVFLIVTFALPAVMVSAQSDASIKGIRKGWNILAMEDPILKASSYSYTYAPIVGKYYQVKPEKSGVNDEVVADYQKIGKSSDEAKKYFEGAASWYYFEKDTDVSFSYLHDPKLSEILLAPGWNFKYFTPSMKGKAFEDIFGTCVVKRAYLFSPEAGWVNALDKSGPIKGELDKINSLVGVGFLVNVDQECSFGDKTKTPAIAPIPQLPN